jgi:hypothetical protein
MERERSMQAGVLSAYAAVLLLLTVLTVFAYVGIALVA